MATTATRSGCELTVTIHIEFQNSTGRLNNQQFQNLVSGWAQSIENLWNGPQGHQTYGCCDVVFEVDSQIGSGTNGYHQIEVVAGPQRSNVVGDGPGSAQGTWDDQDSGNVVAHETGHLMCLDDEYEYRNGDYHNLNPQPEGQPESIMAQTWGNVAALQEHIDAILGPDCLDVDCPWWCCIWRYITRTIERIARSFNWGDEPERELEAEPQ